MRRYSAVSLAATGAAAFMGHATLRRSGVAVCAQGDRPISFFQRGDGDDASEMARLRRENRQLRDQLDMKEREGGPLDSIKSMLGLKKKEIDSVSRDIDEAFKGTGLVGSVLGGLAKAAFGMAGNIMRETQADLDRVQIESARLLEAELGPGVKLDPPFSQSYSSQNINGAVTKRVMLGCTATAASGITATIQVRASISGDDVTIEDLQVNGRSTNGGPRGPPTSKTATIIDV